VADEPIDRELLDAVGEWTEKKHEIISYYATVYNKILDAYSQRTGKRGFRTYYIDAYAAAGYNIRKGTGDIVKGSALRALEVVPKFEKFFFVEMNKKRFDHLERHVRVGEPVELFNGDANVVLPNDVFPQVQYRRHERAFCLLDPYYETNLKWETIVAAAESKTLDVLIHFPVGSINRQVLRKDGKYTPEQAKRLTNIWGDSSWESVAYSNEGLLFEELRFKVTNERLVEAFRKRLVDGAKFLGTSDPIPMKTPGNVTIYYLIFASSNEKGVEAGRSVAKHFIDPKPKK
jgi:three-Cys-motif partner protein